MKDQQLVQIGCISTLLSILFLIIAYIVPEHILDSVEYSIQSQIVSLQQSNINNTNYIQWLNTSSINSLNQQYLTIHFYNIINGDDIINNNHVPIVNELQPLRLKIHKYRFNTHYTRDNYTDHELLQYNEQLYYTVDDKYNTTTTLDTMVTTVNFILLGINTIYPSKLLDIYPDGLYSDTTRLFTQHSIREMLFGYHDELSGQLYPGLLHNMTTINDALTYQPTIINSHNRQLHSWQGEQYRTTYKSVIDHKHRVSVWNDIEANRVFGSDGEYFIKSDIYKNSTIVTYVNDLYRTTLLHNVNGSTIKHNNIELLRYTPDTTLYGNIDTVPSNIVYNSYQYNGILNLTTAYQHLPIYISKPMFIDADTELQSSVQYNMIKQYDYNELETELCVEPNSGITMRAHKRYQININIKPLIIDEQNIWFSQINNHTGRYLPITWLEQSGEISKSNSHMFTQKVLNNIRLAHTGGNILFVTGLTLLVISVISFLQAIHVNKYNTGEIDTVHNDYQQRLLP